MNLRRWATAPMLLVLAGCSSTSNPNAAAAPPPAPAVPDNRGDSPGDPGSAPDNPGARVDVVSLSELRVGEAAYTMPWGMWLDRRCRYWLHPDYDAEPAPDGAAQMLVAHRAGGWFVWVPAGEEYVPTSQPGYVSPADTKYLPVAGVHLDGPEARAPAACAAKARRGSGDAWVGVPR